MKGASSFRRGSTSSMEESLCLLDLAGAEEIDKKKYMEHSAIFDDMVATTAVEYEKPPPLLRRQESCRLPSKTAEDGSPKASKVAMRRHSSFEPRQARKAYQEHCEVKEYISTLGDQERSTFIKDLLDFNLSVNMASMSDLSMMDKSPGLHYSCPVLSYMNDDEEDSVDLATFRKASRKRPSMDILKEEQPTEEDSWEVLNDESSNKVVEEADAKEYQITIKMGGADEKPRTKRRRPPSCQVLSQRLREEHPQQILRSMGAF